VLTRRCPASSRRQATRSKRGRDYLRSLRLGCGQRIRDRGGEGYWPDRHSRGQSPRSAARRGLRRRPRGCRGRAERGSASGPRHDHRGVARHAGQGLRANRRHHLGHGTRAGGRIGAVDDVAIRFDRLPQDAGDRGSGRWHHSQLGSAWVPPHRAHRVGRPGSCRGRHTRSPAGRSRRARTDRRVPVLGLRRLPHRRRPSGRWGDATGTDVSSAWSASEEYKWMCARLRARPSNVPGSQPVSSFHRDSR
jgi:hypothetical protein